MSWQEQLRALDEELALGLISAEEHRLRRDSAISAGHARATVAGHPGVAVGPDGESTRVIQPPGGASDTQVVPSGFAWQVAPPSAAEQTLIVPGIGTRAQHHRPVPAPARAVDEIPPWFGADLPPSVRADPDWLREDGTASGPVSSGAAKALVITGATALVVGLGVGGWFLFGALTDTTEAAVAPTTTTVPTTPVTTTTVTTTTTSPGPTPAGIPEVPDVPATQRGGRTMTVAELVDSGLMDQVEGDLLRDVGVTGVATKHGVRIVGTDGPTADELRVMVIPVGDPAVAPALLDALRAHQETTGLEHIPEPPPDLPAPVVSGRRVVAESAVYRGLYVSGNHVLRITVSQAPFTDEDGLSGSYRDTVRSVLDVFPAH